MQDNTEDLEGNSLIQIINVSKRKIHCKMLKTGKDPLSGANIEKTTETLRQLQYKQAREKTTDQGHPIPSTYREPWVRKDKSAKKLSTQIEKRQEDYKSSKIIKKMPNTSEDRKHHQRRQE